MARDFHQADFTGKYHRALIKNKYPVPGAALKRDLELSTLKEAQLKALEKGIKLIRNKHAANIKCRHRKKDLEDRMGFEKGIGAVVRYVILRLINRPAYAGKVRGDTDWSRSSSDNHQHFNIAPACLYSRQVEQVMDHSLASCKDSVIAGSPTQCPKNVRRLMKNGVYLSN